MHTHFLNQVGQNYLDFEVTKILVIEELSCVLRELTHKPSGTQLMHIANDDPENLFCLSFKTLPSSSNGAAHILEHTVLCGSKKFPVKDPFFSMTRRSLNTFMNAMTGADFTCYPASSQVEKDFYNLLDVYLDAVFHPDLKELSFLQEGCRLEFTKPKDPTTPLIFKGIVFNEMKGSLSSADSRLWHAMIEHLTPDLPYAHNSGGDPKNIPHLTYQELIEFYETFYHPSRCLFYFYGNLPLKQHLDFIHEKTLKHILPQTPLPPIPLQPRFSEPLRKTYPYPVTEQEKSENRTMVSFGWLTCPIIQQEDVLALTILDSLLMDTDASALKKMLLESGLCLEADAFMDNEMSEMPYVITCKGCEENKIDQLEQFLFASLLQIAQTPIEEHLIDAVIHQIEFSRLEISGDHSPFGLTLFLRSALAKQHGCEPENALVIYSLFERLSQKAKDPNFLQELLYKYVINNPHFVRITFIPDSTLASKEAAEETSLLTTIKNHLSQPEIDKILKQTTQLKQYQKSVEHQSLECLPKVTLEDVPLLARNLPLTRKKHKDFETFHHNCFTNHIIHADLCFDLPAIEEEELPYLQLLLTLLPQLGAGSRDYIKNLEYIQAHTGGITASSSLHVQSTNPELLKPCLSIRGKALDRKADKLFSLYRDLITTPDLHDTKRVHELIKQIHSSLISKLPRHALRYAIQEALSGFHLSTHINNCSFGLHYLHTIQEIYNQLEKNSDTLIQKLVDLKNRIFTYQNTHLILSCDAESFDLLERHNFYDLFTDLPSNPFTPWKANYAIPTVPSQARSIAAQVAYNVKAFRSISFIHPHTPALTVATQLFDNKVLLSKIREQGGAYGAGANFSPLTGCFYFHSYRDPHITSTLDAFDQAIEIIGSGQFSETDLEEAKLGIIQQLDLPIAPGNKAITAYNWWRDDKSLLMRQEFRQKIISLSKAELQNAVMLHLSMQKESGVVVCFGNKDLIEKENLELAKRKKKMEILRI
ncbi:MAG: insulinase family protein [Chlamydiia bacterium]